MAVVTMMFLHLGRASSALALLEFQNHEKPRVAMSTKDGGGPAKLIHLEESLAPLKKRFNADTGKLRVLAILSPT